MREPLVVGLLLLLLAGLMSGNCMLPLKFQRNWRWEHSWLVFTLISLLVLPWALAFLMVRHLLQIYQSLPLNMFLIPILFGCGWGIAQILFGISVKRLGLGLAYAIIVGLGAMLGTLVPLVVQHRSELHPSLVAKVLFGILVMIAGIVLTTRGGQLREAAAHHQSVTPIASGYRGAVLLAVLCGLLAPMINYAFAFGQPIAVQAVAAGNSKTMAGYAVWPIGLLGGLVPNLFYSLWLLFKNGSRTTFRPLLPDAAWSTLMAVLWMGAMAIYGVSAVYLGGLGTSVGWGLMQIFMIMTATTSGIWTGEWRGTSGRARFLLGAGLCCLICATVILAVANYSFPKAAV